MRSKGSKMYDSRFFSCASDGPTRLHTWKQTANKCLPFHEVVSSKLEPSFSVILTVLCRQLSKLSGDLCGVYSFSVVLNLF